MNVRTFLLAVLMTTGCLQSNDANTTTTGNGDDDGKADGIPAPCVGVTVPGDYATIQAALDAGSGKAICLRAHTYKEDVQAGLNTRSVYDKPVELVGVGPDQTLIDGTLTLYNYNAVTLRDLKVSGIAVVTPGNFGYLGPNNVRINGCSFSSLLEVAGEAPGVFNVEIANNDFAGGFWLTVGDVIPSNPNTDPWIDGAVAAHVSFHDNTVREQGVIVKTRLANGSGWSCGWRSSSCTSDIDEAVPLATTIDITNNQFSDVKTKPEVNPVQPYSALDFELSYGNPRPQQAAPMLSYTGNTFTGNFTAVNITRKQDSVPINHSGNTFVGNTTNYSGAAQPD